MSTSLPSEAGATVGDEGAPRRSAVIDMGSNSFRLVVFTAVPGEWWKRTDEIHEPVRLLIVCETAAEAMLGVMDRNPVIGSMARAGWVQLAVIHPETAEVRVFRDGEFREYGPQADALPAAASSADANSGWRDHLEFARIG